MRVTRSDGRHYATPGSGVKQADGSNRGDHMHYEFTAVFREAPERGYVAFVEELPGANTQGESLEEAGAICAKQSNL